MEGGPWAERVTNPSQGGPRTGGKHQKQRNKPGPARTEARTSAVRRGAWDSIALTRQAVSSAHTVS
ncbi:hypothetical protein AA0311_0483 [Asaia bogorensis NBRC 16594]|nr:hypothetical protein AA0311_0483 [Asaia bogorensis NBRC 16594]